MVFLLKSKDFRPRAFQLSNLLPSPCAWAAPAHFWSSCSQLFSSPPGVLLCNSIMKRYSTNRMPDVVSTSELSPETAGACVDPRKSFEVRPQKICACRDVDEKQVCTAKVDLFFYCWDIFKRMLLIYSRLNKSQQWSSPNIQQRRWRRRKVFLAGGNRNLVSSEAALCAGIITHCHMHFCRCKDPSIDCT